MKLKVNFFSLMLFVSLFISDGAEVVFVLLPALLHELGHIAAARARGVRVSELNVTVMGARMTLEGCYSYTDEFIIALCGPIVNILCAVFSFGYISRSVWIFTFCVSSVSLGVTNLLPIKSFDGGRMLNSLLLRRLGIRTADGLLSVTSFLSLFAIWCASVYLLLKNAESLSIFVFSISTFANIFINSE